MIRKLKGTGLLASAFNMLTQEAGYWSKRHL